MTGLTQEQKNEIIKRLVERGAVLPCPRCGNKNFVIVDGYFTQTLSSEIGALVLGGQTIPSVVTVCTKCGFISQHALGTLGLLPDEIKEKPKNESEQ
jgi:predicted nucleic-acid-binding Zn-ribbon protein